MLKVVYVASSTRLANNLLKSLTSQGFLASSRCSQDCGPVEILVPSSEAAEALEVINASLCKWGKVSK